MLRSNRSKTRKTFMIGRALSRLWPLHALSLSLSLSISALLPLSASAQEVPKDVKPDHWAYQAVQDLASKGLIKGYPPDGNFLGGRTLTRYEMATIIQRVLARMDDLIKAIPQPPASPVTKDDLTKLQQSVGEIRELVNGFKTELTVIGTDMTKVKDDLAALKTQVGDLGTKVGDLDTKVNGLASKVDETNVALDQTISNLTELKAQTAAALAKKVDIGVGKLRVSGLLQAWGGSAFGDTLGGNFPLNTSGTPPGRNFGGGVGDTFRLRRGEIALVGSITSLADYRVMFDVAKIAGVNTTTGTFTTPTGTATAVTSVTSNAPSNVLQDLWVGYQLVPRLRVEVGQQKTGLSEEGTRSSSQLLTVERSIMNGLPTTAGRVGDIRDTGVMLKFNNSLGSAALGVFNDNGVVQNSVDNDRSKFFMYNAYYTGIRHLTLGAWGGFNFGDSKPAATRDRAGATVLWQSGPHIFEGEGAYTRDVGATGTAGTIALGGYLLYGHRLSSQWQVVGRYDIWDPAYQGGNFSGTGNTPVGTTIVIPRVGHKLREYTVGINYYLKDHNSKIQLNYIREDVEQNGIAFFGKQRTLGLLNFQTAW